MSCPTPCSGTCMKWMHSPKTGGSKDKPVLGHMSRTRRKEEDIKKYILSMPFVHQSAFPIKMQNQNSIQTREWWWLPGLQTMMANRDDTKSSTWAKGNLGTEISIQILLRVTSVSHSMSSPVPGNRPVPAAGIDVCVSMS